MAKEQKRSLGESLVAEGIITAEQLKQARITGLIHNFLTQVLPSLMAGLGFFIFREGTDEKKSRDFVGCRNNNF